MFQIALLCISLHVHRLSFALGGSSGETAWVVVIRPGTGWIWLEYINNKLVPDKTRSELSVFRVKLNLVPNVADG